MSKSVILDSSALIAQINLADSLHEKVQPINEFIAKTNRHVILCPMKYLPKHSTFLARKSDGERQRVPERRSWLAM
jgi:hypothetical protein